MKNKILSILLIFSFHLAFGQCDLKVKTLTIFKDATVFVEKEGNCDIVDKLLTIHPTQEENQTVNEQYKRYPGKNKYVKNHVIFGTVEVNSPGNSIVSKISKQKEYENNIETLWNLFSANKGKTIKVQLKNGKQILGTIFSIEKKASPGGKILNVGDLILESEGKWKFIALNEINDFEFVDTPVLTNKSKKNELVLEFEENAFNQLIQLSYLQKGITWTPNYFLNILADNNLELKLVASIVNDIEILEKATINLAVGIPVFQYATIGEPLLESLRVIELIAKLNDPNSTQESPMLNVGTSQRFTRYVEHYGNNMTPTIEEQSQDDIFLYQLDNVSLGVGDRASLPIFSMQSEYEDVYVVDLQPNKDQTRHSGNKAESEINYVWHSLKFKNNANVPLTTGSVFFKKNLNNRAVSLLVSQGELKFTPINKQCVVKMSVSPNIIVNDSDVEIARERDARGYDDLVSVEANIEIHNLKNQTVQMLIRREILGTVIESSSQNWEIIKTTQNLNELNQNNLVQWNLEIPPNDKKIITYRYEVYVN